MRSVISILFLFTIHYVHFSHCQAPKKDDGLLATPYPGSIVETFPGTTDPISKAIMDARSRTSYTKDPMDKVKAHYTKLLGPFEEYWKDYVYNKSVVSPQEVYEIVTKRGGQIGEGGESFYGGTFAGVTISGPPTNGTTNYSVIKVYESLENAYALRFQHADQLDPEKLQQRLEDPELKQVKTKYEYLKLAYFLETDRKRKDNLPGTLKMDEVIYDKYYTSAAENRGKELEEIQKKYADAMAKMQYDAATKLSDRMMELSGIQPNHEQEWDTAVKCLQEMEKHGYLTKIVIDMHPSKWDLTPPEK